MSSPTVRVDVSGARGESLADIARRVGQIAGVDVPRDANDSMVMSLLSQGLTDVVAAAGYTVVDPVHVATTTNITLDGEPQIDGYQTVGGDRVLVKNQADGSENGIYDVDPSGWVRTADFDDTSEIVQGSLVNVLEGETQRGSWVLVTPDPIVVGTTDQAWRPFNIRDITRSDLQKNSGASIVGYQLPLANTAPATVEDVLSREKWVDGFEGVYGDGLNYDSDGVQHAIDTLSAIYMATGKPQTLRFTDGKTYVIRNVFLKPGVNLIGNGGARLLKTPAAGETDEAVLKNWRMLTSPSDTTWASDAACAHRILIQGLVFDGNLANMNWTNNSYNQEQAHCLMLFNRFPTHAEQRLKAHIDRCHFQNSVADGLSQYINTDLIVTNITGDNCFRGGFVSTGGNSIINLDGYIGENARIDVEVDGAGYGGKFTLKANIVNFTVDALGGGVRPGGCDFSYHDGGDLRVENGKVFTAPFNLVGSLSGLPGNSAKFANCYFTTGSTVSTANRLVKPRNLTFSRTTFFTRSDGGATYDGIQITFDTGSADQLNQKVIFDTCSFSADSSILSANRRAAIYSPSNISANGNAIECVNCTVDETFSYAAYLPQGGKIKWDGGYINTATAWWLEYSGSTRFFSLDCGAVDIGPNCTAWLRSNTAAGGTGNTVKYRGTIIPDAANNFTMSSTGDIANVLSGRTILASAAPVSKPGYKGDVYLLQPPIHGQPHKWIATNPAYAASATWRALEWTVGKGSTANRPVLAANDIGVEYLDTDLAADGKSIKWNGSSWVDATGAVV